MFLIRSYNCGATLEQNRNNKFWIVPTPHKFQPLSWIFIIVLTWSNVAFTLTTHHPSNSVHNPLSLKLP